MSKAYNHNDDVIVQIGKTDYVDAIVTLKAYLISRHKEEGPNDMWGGVTVTEALRAFATLGGSDSVGMMISDELTE